MGEAALQYRIYEALLDHAALIDKLTGRGREEVHHFSTAFNDTLASLGLFLDAMRPQTEKAFGDARARLADVPVPTRTEAEALFKTFLSEQPGNSLPGSLHPFTPCQATLVAVMLACVDLGWATRDAAGGFCWTVAGWALLVAAGHLSADGSSRTDAIDEQSAAFDAARMAKADAIIADMPKHSAPGLADMSRTHGPTQVPKAINHVLDSSGRRDAHDPNVPAGMPLVGRAAGHRVLKSAPERAV